MNVAQLVEPRIVVPVVVGSSPRSHLDYGERSSVGRAPDCGSGCRGFEPHRSNNLIFIAPPSEEILEERLRLRNTENDDVIKKRLLEAKKELQKKNQYDTIIVNNELTQTLNELNNVILSILTKESSK